MTRITSPGRPAQILLVEDNPDDVNLTKLAFDEVDVAHLIHVARDGREAMKFLRREEEFAEVPVPNLVLLDLNMPVKDGHAVLKEVKQDSVLCRIPVIVLTTSDAANDLLTAYGQHANAYLVKPMDIDGWYEMVRGISLFWLKLVRTSPSVANTTFPEP